MPHNLVSICIKIVFPDYWVVGRWCHQSWHKNMNKVSKKPAESSQKTKYLKPIHILFIWILMQPNDALKGQYNNHSSVGYIKFNAMEIIWIYTSRIASNAEKSRL